MTHVRLMRTAGGSWRGFAGDGHTGFAEEGEDIVCAAVSVLLQTAYLGITRVAGVTVHYHTAKGRLFCQWQALQEPEQSRVQLLMDTLQEGLQEIRKVYTAFVSIQIEEVD